MTEPEPLRDDMWHPSPCGLGASMVSWVGMAAVDVAHVPAGPGPGPVIEPYGCEADVEATTPIIERSGLTFG
jgi:hypothetical protein